MSFLNSAGGGDAFWGAKYGKYVGAFRSVETEFRCPLFERENVVEMRAKSVIRSLALLNIWRAAMGPRVRGLRSGGAGTSPSFVFAAIGGGNVLSIFELLGVPTTL